MSQPQEQYLRIYHIIGDKKRGIEPIIPVSRSQWLKGVAAGVYPKSYKIGARAVAWLKRDIDDLVQKIYRREI